MKNLSFRYLKSLFLCCCLTCAAIPKSHAQSGTTGNLSWSISGGMLTINGTGAMPDYQPPNSLPPWLSYANSITLVVIGNGVTSIGNYAFLNCTKITSVTIPNSVTTIGNSAFPLCSSLTSITIPNSVTSIGNSAFTGCSGIKSVIIPNSVTSIGYHAFYESGLSSVTISSSVTSIGDEAFDRTGLSEIINFATTPQTINANVFASVNKNDCLLLVSFEAISNYKSANVWKDFLIYEQSNLCIIDTRTQNHSTNFAPGKFRLDFKTRSTIGVPGSGTYSTSMTISPWTDATGGYVHQLNFNDGGIFYRTGVFGSSWNTWRKVVVENEAGNVGVGTSSPDYKLDVVGAVRAHEILVNTQKTADFVFDPDYPLRSLAEVEQFIIANKHLPEIAPAGSMIQNGVSIGEFQIQLLQKIEELTLYIIDLKKEIEELKK